MPQRPQLFSPKLAVAFAAVVATLVAPALAQDLTNYLTPSVARVGGKLACRCGGCKETVGNCPMLHCDSADPMRHRIYDMQAKGMSDDSIVKTVVQEQGVIALAGQQPLAWAAWLMPPFFLLLGFLVYGRWVRKNRPVAATALSTDDHATLARYRTQIDDHFEDDWKGRGSQRS